MMVEKIQKTNKMIRTYPWVGDLLEVLGNAYGGNSVVAAAAIYHFSKCKKSEKKRILKDFHSKDIDEAYAQAVNDDAAAREQAGKQLRKSHQDRTGSDD